MTTRAYNYIRVRNVSGEAIPAFGVLRATGLDADGTLQAGKPATDGQTDVLFNAATDIPAGAYGQVYPDYPAAVLYDASGGAPGVGDVAWGVAGGDWRLQPGKGRGGLRVVGVDATNAIATVVPVGPQPYYVVQVSSTTPQTVTLETPINGNATVSAYPCWGSPWSYFPTLNPAFVAQTTQNVGWFIPMCSEVPSTTSGILCQLAGYDNSGKPIYVGGRDGPANVSFSPVRTATAGFWDTDANVQYLPGMKVICSPGSWAGSVSFIAADWRYPTPPYYRTEFDGVQVRFFHQLDSLSYVEVSLDEWDGKYSFPGSASPTRVAALVLGGVAEGSTGIATAVCYAVNSDNTGLPGLFVGTPYAQFTSADGKLVTVCGGIVQVMGGNGSGSGSGGSGSGGGGGGNCPSGQFQVTQAPCNGDCMPSTLHLTISGSNCAALNGTYALLADSPPGTPVWSLQGFLACGDSWALQYVNGVGWELVLSNANGLTAAQLPMPNFSCTNWSDTQSFSGVPTNGGSSCCGSGNLTFNATISQ